MTTIDRDDDEKISSFFIASDINSPFINSLSTSIAITIIIGGEGRIAAASASISILAAENNNQRKIFEGKHFLLVARLSKRE